MVRLERLAFFGGRLLSLAIVRAFAWTIIEVYVTQTHVVILSSHSLFAEGVASRLRQHLQQVELEIVDSQRPDVMSQLVTCQPSIVILDISDPGVVQRCSLSKLLMSLPDLKVIRLDLEHEQAQVVTSEQHPASLVRDLAQVIDGGA